MHHWKKRGLIYKPEGKTDWSQTHAQVPFAYRLDEKTMRFFFATRNDKSQTSVGWIDTDAENPSEIKRIASHPALSKGAQGCFDDSGTMPSWFVKHEGRLFLYYTGWNTSASASYRLAIGLAVSDDEGETFTRVFRGPVLDRSPHDPVWVAQPCVLIVNGVWKMWYLSCQKIEVIDGRPEPFYNVRYAESKDGLHWQCMNNTCIDFDSFTDAIGRPCVYIQNGLYKMFYSYRNANGYRTDPERSYRVGYAESEDGINWKQIAGEIDLQSDRGNWEEIMQEYCTRYEHGNQEYLVYNGDGFGASGFGYATRDMDSK